MLAVCIVVAAVAWGGWMVVRVLKMVRDQRSRADRQYFIRKYGNERNGF